MSGADVLAGRWHLEAGVDGGLTATVRRATDRTTGRPVAVKRIPCSTAAQRVRLDREVAALRLLELHGVPRLLDHGAWLGDAYLVTEWVDGTAFPGPVACGDWRAVVRAAATACRVLGPVHAAGVVHRDLKPQNVLVDGIGQVHLLDFGLARGDALEGTVTVDGVPGTPAYLAPEQLVGARVDARTDLFALGVMVWEALAGRHPRSGRDAWAQTTGRRPAPVPPLEVPGVPAWLCALVGRMVRLDPGDRPPSAAAVLRELERAEGGGAPGLPLAGRTELVDTLLEAAHARRPVDVWGAPGVGKSRLVHEVAARAVAAGLDVFVPAAAERGLASLAPLVGAPTGAGALAAAAETLARRLREGLVLIADDADRLDPATRRILQRVRPHGAVIRVQAGPGAVEILPLGELELRALFHGPDRVLHLREDAAAELHRRTGGLPARVHAEVEAWLDAQVARWEGARLRVERPALDRLEAGLAVAANLAPVHPDLRLEPHLAGLLGWVGHALGPVPPEVLAEAAGEEPWEVELELDELERLGAVARRWDGRVQARFVPPTGRPLDESEHLARHRALAAALPTGEPVRLRHLLVAGEPAAAIGEALFQARRLRGSGRAARAYALVQTVGELLRGHLDAGATARLVGELARLALASPVPGHRIEAAAALRRTGGEPRLLALLELAARHDRLGPAAVAAEAAALAPFPEPELDRLRRRFALEGDAARRAEQLRELAARAADEVDQLTLTTQAAALDAGGPDPESAAADVARSIARGAALRALPLELWGHQLARVLAYRRGEAVEPDAPLLALSAVHAPGARHGEATLTEAAVCWRHGDSVRARELGREASQVLEPADPGLAALAGALALALGDPDPHLAATCRAAALAGPPRGATLEALRLLEWAFPHDAEVAATRTARLPHAAGCRAARLRVLAPEELCDP